MSKAAASRQILEGVLNRLNRLKPEMEQSHQTVTRAYKEQNAIGNKDPHHKVLEEHGTVIGKHGRVQIETMEQLASWLRMKIEQLRRIEEQEKELERKLRSRQ